MENNNLQNYIIGIDIGGTKMSAVLMDGEQVLDSSRLATPKDNFNHFMIMLRALIEPLLERANQDGRKIEKVGFGLPGTVNHKTGKVTNSPNLIWPKNINVIKKLSAELKLDCPLLLDNDASCFTRAEAKLGAGKNFNTVYGVTIGTGIGGSLAINGEIYKGAHGVTGEPGALLVDLENKITLEQAYQKLTQNNPRILAQEAYDGDPLAEQIFQQLGDYLGLIFANIVNIVDPGIIIIGGGTASSSDLFLATAKLAMAKHINNPEAAKIKIVKSKLGDLAGAIGAGLLVN